MAEIVEVKFRGDGGEYAGPERRAQKASDESDERTAEDRVQDEIHPKVLKAIKDFLLTGEAAKFVYKPAPDGCTDTDEFRDQILSNSVANIGWNLALDAAGIDEGEEEEPAGTTEYSAA